MSTSAATWKLITDNPSDDSLERLGSDQSPRDDQDNLQVCIVDNDAGIRDSLSFLLESERIPVETYGSAREFLQKWNPVRTGCLVVDIRMPSMSGLELQAELSRQNIHIPLIIITGFGDVQMAVQAMKKGAFDFFEKPIHHQLLLDRLHKALAMETAARQEAGLRLEFQRRYDSLTDTQKKVLALVVQGQTSLEIGETLGCKPKTIEAHRKAVYTKLGCKNLAMAVSMVMQKRIMQDETT